MEIIRHVDDVIVSLDGPEQIHDVIRRVPGTFAALASGVRRLRELNPGSRIAGRCTVQRSNCESLLMTVSAACELGLDSISFLAVDVHSTAFNRPGGLKVLRQSRLSVAAEQIPLLESQIEAIIAQGYCGNFVMESPAKLRRIAHHFRCDAGLSRYVSPHVMRPGNQPLSRPMAQFVPASFIRKLGTLKLGQN